MNDVGVQIGIGVLLMLVGFLLKVTTDTRCEVRKMNGRLGKVEQWKVDHITLVDERHDNISNRIKSLEE